MEAAPVAPNSQGSTGTNAKDGRAGRTPRSPLARTPPVPQGETAWLASLSAPSSFSLLVHHLSRLAFLLILAPRSAAEAEHG